MTNLQHLLNAVDRAQRESMTIIRNGQQGIESYFVVNGEVGYNVLVEDGQVISCTCHHNEKSKVVCKHMAKVSIEFNYDIASLYTNFQMPSNVTPFQQKEAI